jgi:hypothetical protein
MNSVSESGDSSFNFRRERKYLVSVERLNEFHDWLKPILTRDKNDKNSTGYFNHSVYFDSPAYTNYADKKEGISIRIKPRLRTYRNTKDGDPTAYFLEFKNRLNEVNWKERQQIDSTITSRLLVGSGILDERDIGHSELLTKFFILNRRFALIPAATVLYHRRAFTCKLDPSLRITFDTGITGALSAPLDNNANDFQYVLPPGQAILEIKYDFGYPTWLSRIVTDLELELISVSKYGLALESLLSSYRCRVNQLE